MRNRKSAAGFLPAGSKILFIAILGVTLAVCLPHAVADPFNDDLSNWNQVVAHTDILTLDSENPVDYFGDNSRVKCEIAGDGSFYYRLPHVRSFSVDTYFFRHPEGAVEVYGSPDAVTWSRIPTTFSSPQATSGEWYYMQMTPAGGIPEGTNYLGFTIRAAPEVFTPQIGKITATYGQPSGGGPKGLETISAGGQTCLTWYPTEGASSYTVKRGTDGIQFDTIAAGVKTTMYTDEAGKSNVAYYYAVSANKPAGETEDSVTGPVKSPTGAVVFTDPLDDLSLATDHTNDLAIGDVAPNVHSVYRKSSGKQSLSYNMPGLTDFAMTVYDIGGQSDGISADVSTDGDHWTAVPLKYTQPIAVSAEWSAACCTPLDKVTGGFNYLRLTIDSGTGRIDAPRIGQLRLTYGATSRHHQQSAGE